MAIENAAILDETADTPFCKALRWRVHDPEEALWIAATHRTRAREARSAISARIDNFSDRSRALDLQGGAASHDQMAAICEQHAANLRIAIAAQAVTSEKGSNHV